MPADLPTLEEVKGLAEELKMDNRPRNERDTELMNLFLTGEFTGKLYDALRTQMRSSKQRKLMVNICRNAMLDRMVLLTMLPDIKVDPPDGLPPLDGRFWQDRIIDTIREYFWEENWRLPQRMGDIGWWQGVTGRNVLQLFPNFEEKRVELWVRHPSTYFAVVHSSGSGYMADANSGVGYPTVGGYKHCPVLFIQQAKGRELLRDYPQLERIDVKNTNDTYEVVEWWDEKYCCRFVNMKSFNRGSEYKHMITKKGEVMAVEHNLGFVPVEFISDIHEPGRIDATTSIYHSMILGENLNDLILMNTEEHRERLGSTLVIKNPTEVPKQWPAHGNAVVTVGPQGDAKWISKVENPGDMGSHIEGIKQLAYMGMRTTGARMGELPSSGPWLSKGFSAAATIPISDEVMWQRESIARALSNINVKAFKMMRKMFGGVKQTMSIHSSGRKEALTFTFKDLPEHFRHRLEVFPLAHDVPSLAVLLMQLRGQKAISLHSLLERLPGFDAPEEMRRLDEERKKEMEEALQMAQAQAQAEQGMVPEQVEQEAYAMERGAMPERGGQQSLINGMVPSPEPFNVGYMPKGAGRR